MADSSPPQYNQVLHLNVKYTSMFLDSLQKKKCAVQTFIFVIQNDSMYSVTSVKPH